MRGSFIAILVWMLFPLTLLAQESSVPEECASAIKLSLTTDWYPYVNRVNPTTTSGVDVELLRHVLTEMGCKLEVIHFPERRTLFELELGAFDVGLGASWLEERETLFHFSVPYRKETNRFAYRQSDKHIAAYDRFQQLIENDHIIVINLAGWYGEELERAKREFNGFVFSDTVVKRLRMLALNRVDVVVDDEIVLCSEIVRRGYDQMRVHPLLLSQADIHFIFNRRSISTDFMTLFNQTLEKALGSGFQNTLFDRYIKPDCLPD